MLKAFLIFSTLTLYCATIFGQSEELNKDFSADQSEARDRIVFEITNDGWFDLPGNIEYRGYSFGLNAYIIHDIFRKIDKPFSIGIGYGISSHNVHTDGVFNVIDSLDSSYALFNPIQDNANLKKNKFTVNYLEFPVEIRLITENGGGFKFHIGGKLGYKLGDYSKRVDGFGKRKSYKTSGIHDIRYGLHARMGYGRLTAVGYFSLNPLFKKNRGPKLMPYSVGIAFILL